MLAALSLLLAAQQIDWNHPRDNPVVLVDNGFCFGLGWTTLRPGEVATVDYGPDFNVYRVRGPGEQEWGSYSGFAGQSRPDAQHSLLTKDGVTVYRGTDSQSHFNGYFVGDERQQNHFFGTVFHDAEGDAAFFERMEFGDAAKAKCEGYWKR